jgi:hypothetical protein
MKNNENTCPFNLKQEMTFFIASTKWQQGKLQLHKNTSIAEMGSTRV